MPLALVALPAFAVLFLAYRFYGRWVVRNLAPDDARPTPACEVNDGLDFAPTPRGMLLAQHFSAITAAGPIVGPILAGLWFGWGPALLWIVVGCVLVGAVHDVSALFSSIRHRARSVAEVVAEHVGRPTQVLFLGFIWLALVYVVVAFTDITAQAFLARTVDGRVMGPGVATSSLLYLGLAAALGLCLTKLRVPLAIATAVFVPLLLVALFVGQAAPLDLAATFPGLVGALGGPAKAWHVAILAYCFVASVAPMWLLLQPRGYLGGFLLYGVLAVSVAGVLFGGFEITQPAFVSWNSPKGLPLVPFLFVTIACGACSGFHGIVCSGTTSKQVARESDTRLVGYGGMLLEGTVAVLALSAVMLAEPGAGLAGTSPDAVYAGAIGQYVERLSFGLVPRQVGLAFGLLAFTTFIYDTLDVCTRLGRYVLEELLRLRGTAARLVATAATLALPAVVLLTTSENAYLRIWSIFGSSNQLLAALTLAGLTVYFLRTGRNPWIVGLPAAFVLVMTLWSLFHSWKPWLLSLAGSASEPAGDRLIGGMAFALSVLAVTIVVSVARAGARAVRTRKVATE